MHRRPASAEAPNELPTWALVMMIVLAWALALGGSLGSLGAISGATVVVLSDGIIAALVLLAAGGYGGLVFRPFRPPGCSGLFAAATSAGVGLWMLSLAVLAAGSAFAGALTMWVWWPVVVLGVASAAWQLHRALGGRRIPEQVDGASLVWVVAALAAGLWLAGATLPPGWLGNLSADSYDVLEYHLQLPREFYHAGRIQTLRHNVYSHYPLGVEMLYLLGMCLRGGPYEGMYLAKMMGGLFGVVMVAGTFGALSGHRGDVPVRDFRARAAGALLATAPWAIYFSQVALVELGQLCYLALALLWLRAWLERPSLRAAGWLGLMLGAACGVKYLSVGLVAAPVGAVMLVACARSARRAGGAVLAAVLAVGAFAPWAVRDLAATGNPVFPLATKVFGRGHWSEVSARRWREGHAPARPRLRARGAPDRPLGRAEATLRLLGGKNPYDGNPPLDPSWMMAAAAVGGLAAVLARRAGRWARGLRAGDPPRDRAGWEVSLAAVLGIQLVVWALFTHEMPARFIAVAVVPLALLASGGLEKLASVRSSPWSRGRAPAQAEGSKPSRWGLAPAVLMLVATTALNLASAERYYRAEVTRGGSVVAPAGVGGKFLAERGTYYGAAHALGATARVMLVGEARGFYFPPGTIYATVFDAQPLSEAFGRARAGGGLARALRGMGVTHVLVNWAEIERFRSTYGWPAELSPQRLATALAGWKVVREYSLPEHRRTSSAPATRPAPGAIRIFTLYAVPAAGREDGD